MGLQYTALSYSFPSLEPVSYSMSGSICCFLNCIWVSYKTGKVVWYSYLFKNFPRFVVIHTVTGFRIVSEAEVDVALEFPCFFYDPVVVVNLTSCSSPFLIPAGTVGIPQFMYCWSLAWRILSITLLRCEMSTIVHFEHFLAMPLWDWNEYWPFQILWPLLSFPNLLA